MTKREQRRIARINRHAVTPPTGNQKKEIESKMKIDRKGKIGNTPIYDGQRFPHIAETLCADYGFTYKQLARVFSTTEFTIYAWLRTYPEFKEAVKRGKDFFDGVRVENSLLRRALGYNYTEIKKTRITVKGRDSEGKVVHVPATKTETTHKEVPPDVKASIFWLSNRNPDRWSLTVNAKVSGKLEHQHNHSGTVVTAQLEKLNTEQLIALRSMIMTTKKDTGDQLLLEQNIVDAEVINMDDVKRLAEQISNETYEDDDDYSDMNGDV